MTLHASGLLNVTQYTTVHAHSYVWDDDGDDDDD